MANCVVEQAPAFQSFPVGQDVIFVVSNLDAVANQIQVKFVAEVHISTNQINPSSVNDIIGTFKTTPNNAGVGIFNLRNVLENYVKADHTASSNAIFNGATPSVDLPVHLIDAFSKSTDILRYLAIQFKVEYLDQASGSSTFGQLITTGSVNTTDYMFWNGYVKYTDIVSVTSAGSFGYDPGSFFPDNATRRYLTNAPTTQYANVEDYGTLAFLNLTAAQRGDTVRVTITAYNAAGTAYGTTETVTGASTNGYNNAHNSLVENKLIYFGAFPANLQGTWWDGAISFGMKYYVLQMEDTTGTDTLEPVTIYINCPNTQGYESVRLCWLNQWGAWDYYTFTQKSVRTISTQGSTYTQLNGTWNEATYKYANQNGGKKSFRRNATEKLTINTDFITENYNVMFEELMNSPEVYILQGTQAATSSGIYSYELSQYVTPTRVVNSSFVKKTKANDQLIQYTFEVEKSKTLRTQTI